MSTKDSSDINYQNNKFQEYTKEYLEIERNKEFVTAKFGGIPRTLLFSIISLLYTLLFLIFFIIYNEKKYPDTSPQECNLLRKWNRVLIAGLCFSVVIIIFCTYYQLSNRKNEAKVTLILLIRTVINYLIGLIFLIAITVVYFTRNNIKNCPNVRYVDLVYIILEWIIFSVCIILHYIIVVFFCCCKAKRKMWNGEGEIDEEEMRKVISPKFY